MKEKTKCIILRKKTLIQWKKFQKKWNITINYLHKYFFLNTIANVFKFENKIPKNEYSSTLKKPSQDYAKEKRVPEVVIKLIFKIMNM